MQLPSEEERNRFNSLRHEYNEWREQIDRQIDTTLSYKELSGLFALRTLIWHVPEIANALPLNLRTYDQDLQFDVAQAVVNLIQSDAAARSPQRLVATGSKEIPTGAPRLIVVSGKPRSGKDMVAGHLQSTYSRVGRLMTSGIITVEVNEFLRRVSEHQIDESNKSEPQYRHLLQAWGMARQYEEPDYWPSRALQAAQERWDGGAELVVITGVRWPHDARLFRSAGGEIWKVHRKQNPYLTDHYAETGLDNVPDDFFDKHIYNDVEGDLSGFYQQVDDALTAM